MTARDRLCRDQGGGYLYALIGPRGPGKTQLSAESVAYCVGLNRPALYVRAMNIFLDIRETYNCPEKAEKDALRRFTEPRLLIIDEIQQRGETAFEDRILAYVIDRRYGDMTDTILIANLQEEALKKSLDPSIVDRLRETGGIIKCEWPSFRGKGGGCSR